MRNRFYLSLVSGRGRRHEVVDPPSLPASDSSYSSFLESPRPEDPFQQLVDELIERLDEADKIIQKLRRA
jgi:hypothetical protein